MHRSERRTGARGRHGTRASRPRRSAALLAAATAIAVGAIGCTSPAGASDQWTIHRQPTTAASATSSASHYPPTDNHETARTLPIGIRTGYSTR